MNENFMHPQKLVTLVSISKKDCKQALRIGLNISLPNVH